METRRELLQSLVRTAEPLHDFSYSAVLRHVRKHAPDDVKKFLGAFKMAFDEGMQAGLDDVEHLALMSAIKSIGLDIQ